MLLAGLATSAGPPAALAQDTLRAVAVVNDQVISMLDLVMRTRLAMLSAGLEDSPDTRARLQPQVLRALIDENLQLQEAERLGIAVSQSEVEGAIGQIAQQNKMPRDAFLNLLKNKGILPTILSEQIRAGLAWNGIVNRSLRSNVDVREEEVDDVIGRIQADSGSPEIRVAEIFLAVDSAAQENEVAVTAQRLIDQMRAGANFEALARQFSQSATASVGGDLGWIREGQLQEELQPVVRAMKPRQVSQPIRTFGGIYIIYLREERQRSFGDATVRLKQVLFSVPQGAPSETVQQAVAGASDARAQIGSCDDVDQVAAAVGSPGSGDLGSLRLNDLPAEIRDVIANLPVGQPSAPVQLSGGIGVLVVCDRQDGAIDRDKIFESLVDQRLNLLARRYLRDLRRQANIDIRL